MITEEVHAFGDGGGLVGVVTLPPAALRAASEARPFVVLLNSGLVHRVGPYRTGVEVARALAARGVRVLRYDRAGLGDSAPRPAGVAPEAQVVADGRAAMDSLAARYGAARFVIGGLCAGALNAHRISAADPRVIGVWMLDGYAYPTVRYYRERIVRRLRNPEVPRLARRVAELAREQLQRLRDGGGAAAAAAAAAGGAGEGEPQGTLFQGWPPREHIRRELEQMLRRGVRFLFVYSGGWSSFVDPRQFDEMFPRLPHRDRIAVAYSRWADHTYLALEHRAQMLEAVCGFVLGLPAGP